MSHTVEKIGGTSMTAFDAVINNILLYPENPYQRILVVSAYSGITDALLECKRSGNPGIFRLVEAGDEQWRDNLDALRQRMLLINGNIFADPYYRNQADAFITKRLEGVAGCIESILHTCKFSQFHLEDHLPQLREMLAGIGEAHSAFNTALLGQTVGLQATFVDLSGWHSNMDKSVDEVLHEAMADIDLSATLPIVTGYVCCREGLMRTYDRGYSEMTLSRLATVTKAHTAVIHKEYHLSSADPRLVGVENVRPIGDSNYDVADQLANLGMEAIHPHAASGLRAAGIHLQVKNTFEPEHQGTLISGMYKPKQQQVQIIAGKENVLALHLFDQNAVGNMEDIGYELIQVIRKENIRLISKEMNANSLTYYLAGPTAIQNRILEKAKAIMPDAQVSGKRVALVSVIGCHIDTNITLSEGLLALLKLGITPKAAHASMRNVDVQYVVRDVEYQDTVKALHATFVENGEKTASAHLATITAA